MADGWTPVLHHAAFDAHLIGIDPDYRIHVSDRLLEIHDEPFLELVPKGIAGTLARPGTRHQVSLIWGDRGETAIAMCAK